MDSEEILINLASLRLSAEHFVTTIKENMKDAALTIRDIEKFVQAVWAPFGNSVIKFKDLISQLMRAKVSQFRMDGDLMTLSQHLNTTTSHLAELHSDSLQLCKESG